MVGFGALMIANHQGLQSLGRVLTIAMGCCLFSSLVLPNLLLAGGFAGDRGSADNEDSPSGDPWEDEEGSRRDSADECDEDVARAA